MFIFSDATTGFPIARLAPARRPSPRQGDAPTLTLIQRRRTRTRTKRASLSNTHTNTQKNHRRTRTVHRSAPRQHEHLRAIHTIQYRPLLNCSGGGRYGRRYGGAARDTRTPPRHQSPTPRTHTREHGHAAAYAAGPQHRTGDGAPSPRFDVRNPRRRLARQIRSPPPCSWSPWHLAAASRRPRARQRSPRAFSRAWRSTAAARARGRRRRARPTGRRRPPARRA